MTDLKSIDRLMEKDLVAAPGGFVFTEVTQLKIVSVLPSRVLKAIGEGRIPGPEDQRTLHPVRDEPAEVIAWLQLGSTISCFHGLRTLRLWLDYSGGFPWGSSRSRVNEQSILQKLEPLASVPGLTCCVEMPRHCDDNAVVSPLKILRRIRQRYWASHTLSLTPDVACRGDFPLFEAGVCPFEDDTQEEVEEAERGLWGHGLDVEREYMDTSLMWDGVWTIGKRHIEEGVCICDDHKSNVASYKQKVHENKPWEYPT